CITALGCALLLVHLVPGRHGLVTARGLAALAGLTGLLTVVQHLLGVNLGIDTLLFNEAPGSPATVSPNRMGVPASTTIALLAGVFWIWQAGSRSAVVVAIPMLVLLISGLSIIGYLY